MSTFLFDSIIFGPVWSRRLGESLGINLLPTNRKICNFNCVYCECGLTPAGAEPAGFPHAGEVKERLIKRLEEMKEKGEYLDSITFAGNGEPTMHPDFARIIDETLETRNRIFPEAKVTVLSNATLANDAIIFGALQKADLNILKLDSAIEDTLLHINCPRGHFNMAEMIETLKRFQGKLVIQTLFFRGFYNNRLIDNTTEDELGAWTEILRQVNPEYVMIYSIARDTAVEGLNRIPADELEKIARRLQHEGIAVQVTP
jgi:wyosine [tRNA(Phe)-imidazoG37] synthetase (radical SAM superfamily)